MKKNLIFSFSLPKKLTKIILFMKIATILTLICTLSVSASVFSQKVTLNLKDVTVRQAFDELESRTGYKFFYLAEQIDDSRRIDLSANESSIENILDQLFEQQQVKYKVFENNLVVITPNTNPTLQDIKITGQVVSAVSSEPLPGVNVLEKGTLNGVVTDAKGNFTITVHNQDAILAFSYVGYLAQEVAVAGQSVVNLSLIESIESLEEVIVVGYGTSLRKNVTTSIAKIDPADVPAAANSNVNDLLFGKAAGLQVTQQSSQPGGQIDLSVRGRGNPLYVVDGVVVPNTSLEPGVNFVEINNVRRGALAGLNPNDIESIEVLKDGSASIYGVEAANGVILITTKKGKAGKINVNYSGSHSWSKNMPYLQALNATDYMTYYNQLTKDKYLADNLMQPFGPNPVSGVPQPFTNQQVQEAGVGTDWIGQVLRDGRIENHTLGISGGSENINYYFSGNYYDQIGTVENSDMTKYNGRTNLSFKFNKFLTLNTDATATRNSYNNTVAGWQTGGAGSNGFTALQAAIAYPSYLPVRDPITGEYTHFATTGNPVSLLDIKDKTDYNSLLLNMSLDITIIPEVLKAKLLYGNNSENSSRDFYIPSTTNWFDDNMARASLQHAKRQYQTFEAYATFDKKLGDFLNTNIVGGIGQYIYDDNGYGLQSTNMLDAINTTNVGAGQSPAVNSYKSRNTKRSYFVRGTFDILDRYLVTASWRYDGYSQFFPDSKYASFPSVSIGWKISNERFLQNMQAISLLKLRASIGTLGGLLPSGTAYGAYYPDVNNVSFADGTVIISPYYLSQIDNPNLTWQKTINKTIGLDFGMLNNRITGALDLFRDDVTNLLNANALTSPLSMLPTQPVNGGHQVRTGYEINLNAHIISSGSLDWTAYLNVSHYQYRWEERFKEDVKSLPSYISIKDPVNAIYAFESNGILKADQNAPAWQPNIPTAGTQMPGAPLFVDQNGDNTLDSADVKMYDQVPKVTIGLGNTFRYKGFDLTVFLYGQFGAYKTNYSLSWANPSNFLPGNSSSTSAIKDVWSTENPGGTLPGAAYDESVFSTTTIGNVSGVGSDYAIMKSDFVRCRNLTLGYTFNMTTVKKYFRDLRVYFDIQNLFIITKYEGGMDPEILSPAVKGGAAPYPMVRNYSIGVNVNF